MTDQETNSDPAEDLRVDIESAIEAQTPKPSNAEVKEPIVPMEGRDGKGRFVVKGEPAVELLAPTDAKDATIIPDHATIPARPPPGFSVASKSAWDSLPQSIRDDIAKREQEVDSGFKRYAGLGKFAEEAERNGTSLQNAVVDYAEAETALRQDFIGGIEFICQRMGVDPRSLATAMAGRYNTAQEATPGYVMPMGAQAVDPRAIASYVAGMVRTETEERDINSQIASFAVDPKNRFFGNLRQDMAQLVSAGKADTLQEAYEAACWLNPEIRKILISEANGGQNKQAAAVVSKSRDAAKAIGGSPASGINPDAATKRKNLSLDDEIRAAIDAQVGAA